MQNLSPNTERPCQPPRPDRGLCFSFSWCQPIFQLVRMSSSTYGGQSFSGVPSARMARPSATIASHTRWISSSVMEHPRRIRSVQSANRTRRITHDALFSCANCRAHSSTVLSPQPIHNHTSIATIPNAATSMKGHTAGGTLAFGINATVSPLPKGQGQSPASSLLGMGRPPLCGRCNRGLVYPSPAHLLYRCVYR